MLDKTIVVPPAPAGPVSVTVPVDGVPPWTEVGLSESDDNAAGVIASVAVCGLLFKVAEMTAEVGAFTPVVDTVNVAVVWPAATVTELGTVAEELPLDRATDVPPVGAAPERVTVPVDAFPPNTEVGLNVSETRVAGFIVKVAVCGTLFRVPVIKAWTGLPTGVVTTVNVALVFPDATVTDAGSVALEALLVSAIVAPDAPAGPEMLTDPVEDAPP